MDPDAQNLAMSASFNEDMIAWADHASGESSTADDTPIKQETRSSLLENFGDMFITMPGVLVAAAGSLFRCVFNHASLVH